MSEHVGASMHGTRGWEERKADGDAGAAPEAVAGARQRAYRERTRAQASA